MVESVFLTQNCNKDQTVSTTQSSYERTFRIIIHCSLTVNMLQVFHPRCHVLQHISDHVPTDASSSIPPFTNHA